MTNVSFHSFIYNCLGKVLYLRHNQKFVKVSISLTKQHLLLMLYTAIFTRIAFYHTLWNVYCNFVLCLLVLIATPTCNNFITGPINTLWTYYVNHSTINITMTLTITPEWLQNFQFLKLAQLLHNYYTYYITLINNQFIIIMFCWTTAKDLTFFMLLLNISSHGNNLEFLYKSKLNTTWSLLYEICC